MIKLFSTLILLTTALVSVELTGNQHKAYVTKGSIEVSGYGVTQIVKGGQITFYGENISPTTPQKFYDIDIRDIQIELEAPHDIAHQRTSPSTTQTIEKSIKNFVVMGING